MENAASVNEPLLRLMGSNLNEWLKINTIRSLRGYRS